MKILCVAEKPSIAKSVTQILSSGSQYQSNAGRDKYCRNFVFDYRLPPNHGINVAGFNAGLVVDIVVTSVRGHVMSSDFGERHRKWHSCLPHDLFTAPIETQISDDARDIAKNLRQEVQSANLLMIWTDCDREGEHIGSEIVSICREVKPRIPIKRAKFSAIIAAQIHRAVQHPVDLDWNAVAAVESRIELDLRLGAAFTRLQSLTLQRQFAELQKKVVSYGPCQFPTLGFVVEQYCKVMDFVPEAFWYIAVMKKRDNKNVDFHWQRNHLFVEQEVKVIYDRCMANPEAVVQKVTTTSTRKFKPKPLTTVELQKAGGRLLRMAPKRILDVAEKLYQRGILSYPRTETDQYDDAFDFFGYIQKQHTHPQWGDFAQRLGDRSTNAFEKPINGSKNDKAHPPIHPTGAAIDLTGDEKNVYEFITRRFLASCSKHAVGNQTTVSLDLAKEEFHTSGIVVLERNYLDVYRYDTWGGPALPEFRQGERFQPTKIEMKEGETSRPKLLTEADLVSLMDKNGIGTDATIAEHIAKIIDREYVMIQPEGQIKYLVPSTLGMGLVDGHNKILLDGEKSLCKPLLRRETEQQMALICEGTRTKEETISESLREYDEVFRKVQAEMGRLTRSLRTYLYGEEEQEQQQGREGSPIVAAAASTATTAAAARQDVAPTTAASATRSTRRQEDIIDLAFDDDDDDDDDFQVAAAPTSNPPRPQSAAPPAAPLPPPQRSAMQQNGNSDEVIQCRCSEAATLRTVQKEGHNKGRRFWSCAKNSNDELSCGFFEWMDETRQANGPAAPTVGSRRCDCGSEAKRLTTNKPGPNQGKSFWTCAKISKIAQCKFFEWEDDNSAAGPSTRNAASSRGDSSSTVCYKCQEPGHWASECRSNGAAEASGRNGNGSSNARGFNRQANGSSTTTTTATTTTNASCFTCGEQGHWSNACPNKNASTTSAIRSDQGRARNGECYKCGGEGHWASECHESGESSNRGGGAAAGASRGRRGSAVKRRRY